MAVSDRLHVSSVRAMMRERGYDAIVIRNNPDIRWLTGVTRVLDDEVAHTVLVTQDELLLHTDSRYYNAFVTKLGEKSAWTVDMDPVGHERWAAEQIAKRSCHVVAIEDTLTVGFLEGLEHAISQASAACLLPRLHGDITEMRAVKDDDEVARMRAAQAITDDAYDFMCTSIRPGKTELQLRAELDNYMLSHGADSLAFDTIVASGPNTANPHAQPSGRVVEKGDFVLMDFGAGLNDYKSDMTRTVVVGEPNQGQRDLYDLVRRVNEACEAYLRPGVVGHEAHELAVKMITDAGFGDYFKHGLGHGVGVEIHEQPRLSRLDGHTLVPGNVVTVEPGVYLPGLGGVRLEDFGVITETGYNVFTQSSHELRVVGR